SGRSQARVGPATGRRRPGWGALPREMPVFSLWFGRAGSYRLPAARGGRQERSPMTADASEIRILLEELDDGRLRARSADGYLCEEGEDLIDVRRKMDLAI